MPDARELRNTAFEFTKQGKYDEAIQLIDSVIKIDSNSAIAWPNRGIILHRRGKYLKRACSFFSDATIAVSGSA
jgi:tetratricopeptide (TPR) repeat protein